MTLFSLASPFLDVLESVLEDEEGKENDEIGGDGEESDSNHGDDDDDDANGRDSDELYRCCISNTDLPLSESEESEEENQEDNGAAVSEMEEDDNDNAMFVDES